MSTSVAELNGQLPALAGNFLIVLRNSLKHIPRIKNVYSNFAIFNGHTRILLT